MSPFVGEKTFNGRQVVSVCFFFPSHPVDMQQVYFSPRGAAASPISSRSAGHACLRSVTLPGKVKNVFCLVRLAQDIVTLGPDDWYFLRVSPPPVLGLPSQLRDAKHSACLRTVFCDLSDMMFLVMTQVRLNSDL